MNLTLLVRWTSGYRRSILVILIIMSSVIVLTRCISSQKEKEDEKGIVKDTAAIHGARLFNEYAGSEKCISCHKAIYDDHIQTAHYLTSGPASEKNILGSFAPGKNRYDFNPSVKVVMEKRDSGLYQVAYAKGQEKIALRFDITIGSGAKGQSYIHTRGSRFYQMPITYFTPANQWSNSPGFPNNVVVNRPITSRCLECHTTYTGVVSARGVNPEEFDRSEVIYGVDCERCHGPGARHAEFQTKNPSEKKGQFIINPASLTRQQNLDLCILCHGGQLSKIQPAFSFTVGDRLSDYFAMDTANQAAATFGNIDVHGNQYGLLRASKCFRMSETMTCNTCHNTHRQERGKLEIFSERCMSCHTRQHNNFCKIDPSSVTAIEKNCIDCHMPKERSMSVAVQLSGDNVPTAAMLRSHLISVYPEEVKKFIKGRDIPEQKK